MTGGWTPDADARLRELWDQGMSANGIARELQRTKNAVLGRVHRLGLPPRPSPIKVVPGRQAAVRPYAVRRRTTPVVVRATAVMGPARECQWPEGEGRGMRFCGAPTVPDRSYCLDHSRRAFVGFRL